MSQVFLEERRSYLLFLGLLLLTVLFIFAFPSAVLTYAFAAIIWGLLGFVRLSYFLQNNLKPFPKILDLPSTILFGLSKEDQEAKEFVIKRLDGMDFVFWTICGVGLMAWMIYCSFHPAALSINGKNTMVFEHVASHSLPINYYDLALSLTQYGLIGIIVFLSFTYSHSRTLIKWTFYSIVPVYFLAVISSFILFKGALPGYFPPLDSAKGMGLGAAAGKASMMTEAMRTHDTALFRRYIELGWVGAYGLYVLFLPACFLLVRNIAHRTRATIRPFIGIVIVLTLFLLDMSMTEGFAFLYGAKLLGLVCFALCWGAAGYRR